MCTVARTSVALAALIVCACGVENPEHRLQTDAAVTDAAVTDAPATTVDGGSTATDGALARDAETESDAEVDGAISCNSAFPSYEDLEVGQSTSYTTCDGKSHTITLESQSLDTLTLTVDGFSLAFDLAKSRCGSPGRQLPKDFHGVKVLPEVTSDIEKVAACDPGDGKYRRWKHLRVAWETGDEAADKDIEDPGSARLRLSDPDGSLPFGLFPITSVKTCSQLLDAASNLFLDPVSYGFHAGIDFPLPVGTPLVAVRPGKVVKVDRSCVKNPSVDCHACGNYVVIEDETYNTWYCHMHKVVEGLTTGQTVAAGQYLGESGASNTKGLDGGSPHLHFHLAENARSDLDDESVFSVNAYPFLDAWCNEHTARPEPSPDNAHRIRSFRLSTVADAGGKETGEAYCTAKGLKCLSVDRLWHNGDEKWLPFESDQGDWYAKSCTKKMLTEASSDGMAKVVNCYGANAAGSADELLLFGLHDPLSARSKRTATAYCSARGLGSAGADWLYAEQGSAPRCWYGGSPKKWWCPFGTSSTLRSHWKSSNDSLAHDSGLARQVYCVGREQDTTDKTHAIHRYYLDKASQAGVKSASELCWKWGMTCLGVEWLHREGCAKDGWCTRDELGSEVDWAQWKHFGCSEAISNATYDGLARVVSCRSYRSE